MPLDTIVEWEKTEAEGAVSLQKIVVAFDGSAAAENALKDAALLAGRHRAEVLIVHIDALAEATDHRPPDVAGAINRLSSVGVRNRELCRRGVVSEMIMAICEEEKADLVMLGAYGYGAQERETLGSTAEQLLRALPCPAITYGPRVRTSIFEPRQIGPILFPIGLPCNDAQLPEAVALAKFFRCPVEVFHSVPYSARREIKWVESECLRVTKVFRAERIRTSWAFVYGIPDLSIWSKADELKSPFILMPLKPRTCLSATTSDNVAAHVIRHAGVPVMSYRFD